MRVPFNWRVDFRSNDYLLWHEIYAAMTEEEKQETIKNVRRHNNIESTKRGGTKDGY